ncbi:hypothetical protein S7335_1818 [Synechococcus sp. PCC 7335]|nr:hypothetical protein S7335_1818 [Synechococcus sp. PCC 7335]
MNFLSADLETLDNQKLRTNSRPKLANGLIRFECESLMLEATARKPRLVGIFAPSYPHSFFETKR